MYIHEKDNWTDFRWDSLGEADTIVTTIQNKSFFWQKASSVPMTERQTQMLNLFLDEY